MTISGAQLPLDVQWLRTPSFSDFVADLNFEVVAATVASATAPGPPLLLHGARGSGKTHLLQAAVRLAHDKGRRAVYLPGPRHPEALMGYEGFELVAIDDCFTAAPLDEHTAIALSRLMDVTASNDASLLLATREGLQLLQGRMPRDLYTRLSRCSIYALRPLSDTALREALQRQARARGLTLGTEVADYLIHRLPRDMQDLVDVLDQLDRASLSAQHRLTIPFVQQVLAALTALHAPPNARTAAG